jgi:hypothetical protein
VSILGSPYSGTSMPRAVSSHSATARAYLRTMWASNFSWLINATASDMTLAPKELMVIFIL